MLRSRSRLAIGVLASLAVVLPLGAVWAQSRLPGTYSVMDMGYPDTGGGPALAPHGSHPGAAHGGSRSVAELTGPRGGVPDASATLVAREQRVRLPNGRTIDGYTLNGRTPGPLLRVRQGDLVQVTLVNESVRGGATLHWHGVDVPNAEDGVAGVTQDAVPPGGRHVYRFVAQDAGTYWYHSHQVSDPQVRGGLFGVLVVEPRIAREAYDLDTVAEVHTYEGTRTVGGETRARTVRAAPGDTVRVRVVNTDNAPFVVSVRGAAYRVLAVDGHDVVAPTPVRGAALQVAAGGRADLGLTVPHDGSAVEVRLGADGTTSLLVGPEGARAPSGSTTAEPLLDVLTYGSQAPLRVDVDRPDRRFAYVIGRRPGIVDGRPGLYWTINGHLYPDLPMFMVAEGDVVRMTVENTSGELHPMHLHGHHAVVLSRNGVRATGSPWWVDSLDVASGDRYEIAFVADNPGIWMDHCHNLRHASEGLVAHVAYEGVSTPFRVGGPAANEPE
jgi:FtsP/CotA-like multicopper oxidase with cupredoxin domain